MVQELPGPVGERNVYTTEARGIVLCIATNPLALMRQIGSALATGNRVLVEAGALQRISTLPGSLCDWVRETTDTAEDNVSAILFDGSTADLHSLARRVAARPGPIVSIHTAQPAGHYPMEWLVKERSTSTNTTAAGGNAKPHDD